MRRALAITCLSISLSLLSLAAANDARACSCIQPPSPVEAARDASVVFHGKLLSVADAPKTGGQFAIPNKIFTFEVVRSFKGQLDAQVNIVTADNSAACGRSYGDPGSEWLIYARTDDQGQTNDSLCSRSRTIEQAAEDIAALEGNTGEQDSEEPPISPGPAEPEVEPVMPTNEPEPAAPSKKGCSTTDDAGGLAGLALLLGLGALLDRRRRAG